MAPATPDELAEAHAEILSTPGHEKKTYSLGGSELISFSDIAKILEKIKGRPVPFSSITPEE
jgi:NAD(P)H dehydrogenase (quinone)